MYYQPLDVVTVNFSWLFSDRCILHSGTGTSRSTDFAAIIDSIDHSSYWLVRTSAILSANNPIEIGPPS